MATILYRYAQYKGYDPTGKADLSKIHRCRAGQLLC